MTVTTTSTEVVTDRLCKQFGKVVALDHVTVGFGTGATALLGRNGAGKTTLINLVAGVVFPTSGTVSIGGHRVGTQAAADLIARQMELPTTAGFLTPKRLRRIFRLSDVETDRLHGLLEEFAVPDRAHGKLSTGNQLKFALALAFARNRPILLLDEPTAGLDIFGVEILTRLIAERTRSGQATLVATHQPTLTPDLFDRAVVIDQGRLLYDGNLDGLLQLTPDTGEAATTRLANAMTRLITGVTA
ncbi:MAG TPA: ABC transporter ATP-binding protein [Acidimicrobiia bacterium]